MNAELEILLLLDCVRVLAFSLSEFFCHFFLLVYISFIEAYFFTHLLTVLINYTEKNLS